MSWSSPRQGNKSKGHKNRNANSSSPQIWLPKHLSAWPDVKMPKSPASAPKAKSNTKLRNPNKIELVNSRVGDTPQEKESTREQLGTARPSNQKQSLSLSDDEDDESTANSSSGDSQYKSADEDSFSKTRSGSNLTRKVDELSSGSDCELTDDDESDGKVNGSQLTLEDGASERKEVLKDATASQKRDKTTGKKNNKDKGGSENVFNARSPEKETSGALKTGDPIAATQTNRQSGRKSSPVTNFLNSLEETFRPQSQSQNTPRNSPAHLRTTLNESATPKDVPVRSRSSDLPPNEQAGSPDTTRSQRARQFSVAYTEAQRQAQILSRRGHREFSSKVFKSSDEEFDARKTAGKSEPSTKGKKKDKNRVTGPDPVEVEIAKQQARLKEHAAKKMKENPERYLKKGEDKVYELTSDDEPQKSDNAQSKDVGGSDRARDAAAPSPSSHETVPDQSVTKKDKKRKRKRNRRIEETEEAGRKEKKRKRSEGDNHDEEPQDEDETAAMLDDFLGNLQTMANALTHGMTKKISSTRKASMRDTINSLKEIDFDEPPSPTALNYHKAKRDAEVSAVLKSLWPILPKALLHSTMRNLNKANRASLGEKLRLCLKGKQTNPNIRVVKRVDEHGDNCDLLEEYGVVSEPDPYTMSSDLTLLTAARSLIVLLSGQRTGLDLSAMVEKAVEGKEELVSGDLKLKKDTQENPGGVSAMEEELRWIASERQKEVEKLKDENRILMARLNRSKW